ncbi:SusC/RagA family TonB-linked outer membrane protein [Desertivirga arenae]|uniref:SusC/RagA family TonB-linked outer membrane protein n=1 Tax=Desertivirga arenae TaxID=2810309 RepID=UPI001A974EFB|nr:TonB-dependent receptor [Pedobacter sp. SYSU D00823]
MYVFFLMHNKVFCNSSGKLMYSRAFLILLFTVIAVFLPSDSNAVNFSPTTNLSGSSVQEIIKGIVKDNTGEPLPGVSVKVKGASTGTQTDKNGAFSISAPSGAVLIFSFIGFQQREVAIKGSENISVTLAPQSNSLTEVVVNGYTSQKRADVTAAISTISGKELLRSPVTNVTQALAGVVPGLVAQQTQGRPGFNSANLYIRGRVSSSATALIIVDGVERTTFGDIDPNEIESVNILKDAASTALYGLKGANGVIVITTKRGKTGPARVTFSSNFGFVSPTSRPGILGAYESAMIYSEGQDNIGEARTFTDEDLQIFKAGTGDPLLYPNVNWYDELVKDTWYQNQQNLTVSGGTKNVRYFTSFGYQSEQGNFKEFKTPLDYSTSPSYSRYNFRARVGIDISPTTNFEANLAGRNEHRYSPAGMSQYNDPAGVVGNGIEGLVGRSLKIPTWGIPFFPQYTNSSDPDIQALDNTYNHIVNYAWGVNSFNPYAFLTYGGYAFTDNNVAEAVFTLNQKLDFLTQGLSLKAQLGYDATFISGKLQRGSVGYFSLDKSTRELSPFSSTYNDFLGAPAYTRTGYNKTNLQVFLNYARTFGKHNVSGNFIGQRELRGSLDASAPFANQGIITKVDYNFGGKYLFGASATYNGSENYAKGYRYGFFPAVSLGYNIANENFMKEIDWISMLKLRGSVGKVGIPSPGTGRFYYQDRFGAGANIPFGNPNSNFSATTYTQTQYGNPYVSFETSLKRNIALDATFLRDKLSFTAELFDDRRSNILTTRGATSFATYGATVPNTNYGVNYNHGYELSAGFQNRSKAFTYSITANMSFARNRREVLDEAPGVLPNLRAKGTPLGTYYGYHFIGFYKDQADIDNSPLNNLTSARSIPGDLKFEDINGDGMITNLDRMPIGHPDIPEYNAGLNIQLGYKGFQISALFNAVDNVSSDLVFYSNTVNQYYGPMLGRWRPDNTNATWPAIRPGLTANPNENVNDFFLQDASYIKLRNVQLAYSFPKKVLNRLHLSNLMLIASGQNLFTWTNFYGVDPENNIVGGTYNSGTTVIPTTKIINLGLNVTF